MMQVIASSTKTERSSGQVMRATQGARPPSALEADQQADAERKRQA